MQKTVLISYMGKMMRMRLLCIRYLFATCRVSSFTTHSTIYGVKCNTNRDANVVISQL